MDDNIIDDNTTTNNRQLIHETVRISWSRCVISQGRLLELWNALSAADIQYLIHQWRRQRWRALDCENHHDRWQLKRLTLCQGTWFLTNTAAYALAEFMKETQLQDLEIETDQVPFPIHLVRFVSTSSGGGGDNVDSLKYLRLRHVNLIGMGRDIGEVLALQQPTSSLQEFSLNACTLDMDTCRRIQEGMIECHRRCHCRCHPGGLRTFVVKHLLCMSGGMEGNPLLPLIDGLVNSPMLAASLEEVEFSLASNNERATNHPPCFASLAGLLNACPKLQRLSFDSSVYYPMESSNGGGGVDHADAYYLEFIRALRVHKALNYLYLDCSGIRNDVDDMGMADTLVRPLLEALQSDTCVLKSLKLLLGQPLGESVLVTSLPTMKRLETLSACIDWGDSPGIQRAFEKNTTLLAIESLGSACRSGGGSSSSIPHSPPKLIRSILRRNKAIAKAKRFLIHNENNRRTTASSNAPWCIHQLLRDSQEDMTPVYFFIRATVVLFLEERIQNTANTY